MKIFRGPPPGGRKNRVHAPDRHASFPYLHASFKVGLSGAGEVGHTKGEHFMETDYLTSVKQYGKIDWKDEDELLGTLIAAAKETLSAAGVPDTTDSALYRLAVSRLAMHYYENREEIGTSSSTVPMGMNWMIEHLRLGNEN